MGGISRTGSGTINATNLIVAINNGAGNSNKSDDDGGPTTFNGTANTNFDFGGNPNLGPLQDNGGLTFTMMPLASSPVFGVGIDPGSSILYDQRGFARRASATGSGELGGVSASTDQGAVEFFPRSRSPMSSDRSQPRQPSQQSL